ncbi:hypothetical protein ROHU_005127 [Labeo rohita]|uniref:Uncharacterized protein n=1 Tax=Labeo rohita TaxID=84645 RepID=A0A498NFC3_LABRO|nr:hypothetical protein ROHU_005127 [Labeo rohita]
MSESDREKHLDLNDDSEGNPIMHCDKLSETKSSKMVDTVKKRRAQPGCIQSREKPSLQGTEKLQIYPPDGKKDIRSKEPAALSSELEVQLLAEGGYLALACLFDSSSGGGDFRSPPPHTHTHTHTHTH